MTSIFYSQYNPSTSISGVEGKSVVDLTSTSLATLFSQATDYSGSTIYTRGDLAYNQSSIWVYVNTTPNSGHAPPTLPVLANSYWEYVSSTSSNTYIWIAYANSTNGTTFTDFTTDSANTGGVNRQWIGIASNRTSVIESTNPADYSWTRLTDSMLWTNISGIGKPEDNATYGARSGVNLRNNADTAYLGDADIVTNQGTAAALYNQAWAATNGAQAAVDNTYARMGQNLIANSDQPFLTWGFTGYNPNGATIVGPSLSYLSWPKTSYALGGNTTNNVHVYQSGIATGTADGSGDTAVAIDMVMQDGLGNYLRVPVIPGQKYIASAYLANHGCRGAVFIGFYDINGTAISYPFGGNIGPINDTCYTLEKYGRSYVVATAPAGAVFCAVHVRKYNTLAGGAGSYLWVAAPMLEVVNANVSTPSPYQSGPPINVRQLGFTGDLAADVTGTHIAAGIAGQGSGATANNLAQLDATAAAQLTTAYNGGVLTVGYGETLKRRLGVGASINLAGYVACYAGGSSSGTIKARIEYSLFGSGNFSTVATGPGGVASPTEPGSDEVSDTFTNSTGIEQLFEFRVVAVRTPSTAGGAIIYSQSYLVG